jgi:hypothetical protein
VVLANLEVTDTLEIVLFLSILLRGYTFGAVCDSFGILPKPNGATGRDPRPLAPTRRSATVCEAFEVGVC